MGWCRSLQASGAAAAAATDWGVNGAAAVQQRRGGET